MIRVRHRDFDCWSDSFRTLGDTLYFLSLFGDHNAVRAVWAGLAADHRRHRSIQLGGSGEHDYSNSYNLADADYVSIRQPIGHQRLHLVMLHPAATVRGDSFTDEICVLGSNVETLYWQRFCRQCPIPLRPEWRDRIWALGRDAELIRPLAGHGDVEGVWISCKSDDWAPVIGDAIRTGGLR